jgi:hypothetical protein
MRAPPEHETMMTGSRGGGAPPRAPGVVLPTPHRQSAIERPLDRPGDLFPDHDAHAAADEAVLHRGDDSLDAVDAPGCGDDRLVQPGRLDACREPLPIGLRVGEGERIGRFEAAIVLLPVAVEERAEPFGCREAEVVRTLGAHAEAGDQVLVVDDLSARRTFHPQAFGHPALLVGRLYWLFLLLEPGHS